MIHHLFVHKVTRTHLQIPLLAVFVLTEVLPGQGQDFTIGQEPEDPAFIQTPTPMC